MVVLLGLLIGGVLRFQPHDDAYITYRVADQSARGQGLVYNVGERVEASSCFLFTVLLSLGQRAWNANPVRLALLLNTLALLAALAAACRVADPPDRTGAPQIPWLLLAFGGLHPAMVIYLFSGMETVFFSALLFLGFAALVGHLERGWSAMLAGLAIGLAADVRLEAVPFGILAALQVLTLGEPRRCWRHAAALLLGLAIIFLPALAWRWSFYGYPFPNTYYAKVGGLHLRLLARGAIYSLLWLVLNWPAVLALALSWPSHPRTTTLGRRQLLSLSWLGAYLAYNVYVGGDYFTYHRFFVPTILIVAWTLHSHTDRLAAWLSRRRWNWEPWQVAVGFYLLCCAIVSFYPPHFYAYRQELKPIRDWVQLGRTLRIRLPQGCSVAVGPAGAFPYGLGARFVVHDSMGLTDAELAHRPNQSSRLGIAGHDREDWNRTFELSPDLVFVGFVPDDFDGLDRKAMQRAVALAKRVSPTNTTMLEALFNEGVRADYRPVELRDFGRRAVFLLRKEASMDLKRLFHSTTLLESKKRPARSRPPVISQSGIQLPSSR